MQYCGFPVVTNLNACGRQWLRSPAQRAWCLFGSVGRCWLFISLSIQGAETAVSEFICVKEECKAEIHTLPARPPQRGPFLQSQRGFLNRALRKNSVCHIANESQVRAMDTVYRTGVRVMLATVVLKLF